MAATEPMLVRLRPLPSYPSPHERERVVGRESRSEAETRVGGATAYDPHPVAHFIRADPPHKGEGSTALDGWCEGRAR